MSLPNPINVTYVSPSVEDTFPFQYIVKDTDNIINIDTTNGAVDVILRNIRNSGMLQYQPLLSINDGGNNATTNNITIYPSEGDLINDSTSFVINTNGGNSALQISNINQWLTTSSQGSGSGGGLNGLNYTYVYGNGENALENGQQLLNGYAEAITKVTTNNLATIDYGVLDIIFADDYSWNSAELNNALLQPYLDNGELPTYDDLTLILDGVSYTAQIQYTEYPNLQFVGLVSEENPAPPISTYASALITNFLFSYNKSTLIVGSGIYHLTDIFELTNEWVDVVSLTGNADVYVTNNNAILINDLYYTAMSVNAQYVYVRGINTGTQAIITGYVNYITFEKCIGGNFSFSSIDNFSDIYCIDCVGGNYSFGATSNSYGIYTNCIGGDYCFSGSELYGANGTYINCEAKNNCFGGLEANGVFKNCKAYIGSNDLDLNAQYSFGYTIDSTSDGTFINCTGGDYCFGANSQYGYFENCTAINNGFGAIDNNSIAGGIYRNCSSTGENSFGATASGDFYNCLLGIGGEGGDGFGYFGDANGRFENCSGAYGSFGSSYLVGIASGIFINCIGNGGSFGYADASGSFYNCVGTYDCFGDLNASGYFFDCIAEERSFCGNSNNLITAQASGYFYNCIGRNICFAFYGNASGYFLNCSSDGNSFGNNGIASGKFLNCSTIGLSFGSDGGVASGYFQNCSSEGGSFGYANSSVASGVFIGCSGGNGSFGGDGDIASGTFTNCVGGDLAFAGGLNGTASGTFTNCTSGSNSFGGGGTASGTFVNCTALADSFGGDGGITSGNFVNCTAGNDGFGTELTGILSFCKLTIGTFPTVSGAGKTRYCLDGNNATNNQG